MPMKAITRALERLERAWLDICQADIQMTPDDFVKAMTSRSKRLGLIYSEEWMEQARVMLSDRMLDIRTRNLILSECHPEEIRSHGKRLDRALTTLLGLVEFAHKQLHEFVMDDSKDEYLRQFVWFRLYLPAVAHKKAGELQKQGKMVGFNDNMPFVMFRELAIS